MRTPFSHAHSADARTDLFKYLLRQLLADLPAAFDAYRPLLAHERPHVREFAAESFSYLLRRTPAPFTFSSSPSSMIDGRVATV